MHHDDGIDGMMIRPWNIIIMITGPLASFNCSRKSLALDSYDADGARGGSGKIRLGL